MPTIDGFHDPIVFSHDWHSSQQFDMQADPDDPTRWTVTVRTPIEASIFQQRAFHSMRRGYAKRH